MKRLLGYWRAYAAGFSIAYSFGVGAFAGHAERRFIVKQKDALDALYLRFLAPAVVATIGVTAVTLYFRFLFTRIQSNYRRNVDYPFGRSALVFYRLGHTGAEEILELAANFRIRKSDMMQELTGLIANQDYGRFSNFPL